MNVIRAESDTRLRIHCEGELSEDSSAEILSGRRTEILPMTGTELLAWKGSVEVNATNAADVNALLATMTASAGAPVMDPREGLDWEGGVYAAASLRELILETRPKTAGQTGVVAVSLDGQVFTLPIGGSFRITSGPSESLTSDWEIFNLSTMNAIWAVIDITILAQTPPA